MTTNDEFSELFPEHAETDTVPHIVLDSAPPKPEFTLHVHSDSGTLSMVYQDAEIATVPYNMETIQGLSGLFKKKNELADGISLKITEEELATTLGIETLMQVTMLNVVFNVFPQRNRTVPRRQALPMHSMEAEINYIRNAPKCHEYNHLHILKNRFVGLPLLMVLPGPSFDLDFIRKHRSQFIVMGVGRAAGKMLEADISPDIIFIQDVNANAWEANFGHLGDKRVPSILIANPLGRIWQYKHNFKRILKAWNLYSFEHDKFPRIKDIPPSSVSGAYSAAKLMGFSSIVFTGNDCGNNIPPIEENGIPESLTNLDYDRVDGGLQFTPTRYEDDLRFCYDGISITTKSEYLAGAQWLKSMAAEHQASGGPALFDRSQTKLTQFNSPIRDIAEYSFGPTVRMPALPLYEIKYDILKYLTNRKNSYKYICRALDKGKVPPLSLDRPFSCIYSNTYMATYDITHPIKNDLPSAWNSAHRLLKHIEVALSELGSA